MSFPEDINAALGDEIAYWRRRRNLSREELGSMVGVSGNTIGRWERGDTTPDVAQTWAITDAMRVNIMVFMGRVEESITALAKRTPEYSIERERAIEAALTSRLFEIDDLRMQAVISNMIRTKRRHPREGDEAGQVAALGAFLDEVSGAAQAGLITTEDLRKINDSLDVQGIEMFDLAVMVHRVIVKRMEERGIKGPNPPQHVLAANDPGEPSEYERVTREQDDAYDIDQSGRDAPEYP